MSDVVCLPLEMLVGVLACRAFLGGSLAFIYIAAYKALPFYRLVALPYGVALDTVDHLVEALHMVIFYFCDLAEGLGDILESLFLGSLGSLCVLFNSFCLLLFGGNLEIVDSLADHPGVDWDRVGLAAGLVEQLEKDLGVTQFVVGSLVEYVGILEI